MKMRQILVALYLLTCSGFIFSQQTTYKLKADIAYYPEEIRNKDAYTQERCVLDLYYPENVPGFPTVIWFHGGGLTGGEKFIPEALKEKGMAVIAVNYRLSPKVKAPV